MDINHFSDGELSRYARQLNLPAFGAAGQLKLKEAKVLVIGAGGLGCPLLLYLVAAGVGKIGIVDFDVVDESNLHRQVLYTLADVGKPKAEAAKERLLELNPLVDIVVHTIQVNRDNIMELLVDFDVVADGSDNFPTRYLVNDACVLAGKPNVFGSVFRFEGQLSVFNYQYADGRFGPNYRDLFPTPPPPDLVPNCAEGGVLGVLPGIIGSMQAAEIIKLITGIGAPLVGRLYLFDAEHFETRTLKIKKNPNTHIEALIEYDAFCGIKTTATDVQEITVQTFKKWQEEGVDFQLIDVREPYEYEASNIDGELIPLATLLSNKDKISSVKKVVVHCKSGNRSAKAIRLLKDTFDDNHLYNLKGGIDAFLNS